MKIRTVAAGFLVTAGLFSCGGSEGKRGEGEPQSANRYNIAAEKEQTTNLIVSFSVSYVTGIPTPEAVLNESAEEDPHYAVAAFVAPYDSQSGTVGDWTHLTYRDIRDFGGKEKFGYDIDPSYSAPEGVVCWNPPNEAYSFDFSVDLSYPIADLPFDDGTIDYSMTVEDAKGNYAPFLMASGCNMLRYHRNGDTVVVTLLP